MFPPPHSRLRFPQPPFQVPNPSIRGPLGGGEVSWVGGSSAHFLLSFPQPFHPTDISIFSLINSRREPVPDCPHPSPLPGTISAGGRGPDLASRAKVPE